MLFFPFEVEKTRDNFFLFQNFSNNPWELYFTRHVQTLVTNSYLRCQLWQTSYKTGNLNYSRVLNTVRLHQLDSNEIRGEDNKLDWNNTRMLCVVLKKSWKQHPKNSSCLVTYLLSHKPFEKNKKIMLGSATELRKNSLASFFYDLQYMDILVLAGQKKPYIYQICVNIGCHQHDLANAMNGRNRYVCVCVWVREREREREKEREREESVLSTYLDEDEVRK